MFNSAAYVGTPLYFVHFFVSVSRQLPLRLILSSYKIFGLSLLVYIALIITIIVWFVLNRTVYGKHLYIVGGNKDAAKVSGVNINFIII